MIQLLMNNLMNCVEQERVERRERTAEMLNHESPGEEISEVNARAIKELYAWTQRVESMNEIQVCQ